MPSTKNSIKELQEESKKLPKVSVAKLRKKIKEQAALDLNQAWKQVEEGKFAQFSKSEALKRLKHGKL